jgi:hypothetical protein
LDGGQDIGSVRKGIVGVNELGMKDFEVMLLYEMKVEVFETIKQERKFIFELNKFKTRCQKGKTCI